MKRVLIIDDAQFMRMALTNIFEKNHFLVVGTAINGADGVKKFKELEPDFVTLDLTMPVMDGLEALQKILEINPNANVIICSAMGQHRLVVKAIELGAKDFIVKPFHEERVIDVVNQLFQ